MNKHLNLFYFFQDYDTKYYENNLTRALALCLKNDSIFLDRLLTHLLPEELYHKTFDSDYPNHQIYFDIQKQIADLNSYEYLIAVATTAKDINLSDINGLRSTEAPIPDIVIEIDNILIIFEVKTTEEDCSGQLENQIAKIIESTQVDKRNVHKRSFSWMKIMKLASNVLSFEKQIGQVNPFLHDFFSFIEVRHTNWLPIKKLHAIPYPTSLGDYTDPNESYLMTRLNQIKQQMNLGELVYHNDRIALSIDYGWASEINILPRKGETITLNMWPGDTKAQGYYLFKEGKEHKWITQLCGFNVKVEPYFKFSHFNKGITWLGLNKSQAEKTHTYAFFIENAGKWRRDAWPDLDSKISKVIPNWKATKDGENWIREFEDSKRTYFDLSLGYEISIEIPYKKAQQLDFECEGDISKLALVFKECSEKLKEYIDCNL